MRWADQRPKACGVRPNVNLGAARVAEWSAVNLGGGPAGRAGCQLGRGGRPAGRLGGRWCRCSGPVWAVWVAACFGRVARAMASVGGRLARVAWRSARAAGDCGWWAWVIGACVGGLKCCWVSESGGQRSEVALVPKQESGRPPRYSVGGPAEIAITARSKNVLLFRVMLCALFETQRFGFVYEIPPRARCRGFRGRWCL